jgi:two-component system CheB/CheR fusion protein
MATTDPAATLIVIAVPASAPDGLLDLASGLPAALAAPILLVRYPQPQRPEHRSDLQTVPGPLPVRLVQERQPLPLTPGVIYAVPPSRRAVVRVAEVVLTDEPAPGSNAVLDPLLTSAAEVFAEDLIAVILGEAGTDGASGAWAVKLAGGIVIAQDAAVSGGGELLALVPNAVDLVAAPARIGALLATLLADPVAPAASPEQRLLDALLREIRTRHGLDFSAYKPTTLWRRLQQRIAATGAADLAAYTRFAAAHPEEYRHLADAFLIKVTAFYRDPDLFACLRADVLPALIQEARGRDRELRLWSAGCATGEEAYTLALPAQ